MKNSSKAPVKEAAPRKLTLVGLGTVLVCILMMLILWLVPHTGANDRNPVMIFMDRDGNFPVLSMMNTLHAAGFEYELCDDDEIPDDGRNYVIVSFGEEAYGRVTQYMNSDNVLGFVLIDPVFPGNATFEGMSGKTPAKDIAIFAGKDSASDVASMGDARLLYERLSGDDTVYGTPIKRGGLFSSECYINNYQNRYLSLSHFNIKDSGRFLFSPLFQNELAGYLSLTYQEQTFKYADFGRINLWFVLSVLSVFAAFIGICVYLMLLPVVMSDIKQEKVPGSERIACAAIGGISLAFAIGVVAMTFFERLRKYCPLILCVMPVVFMGLLFVSRIRFIINNNPRFVPRKGKIRRPLFMCGMIALSLMFPLLMFGDTSVYNGIPVAAAAIVAFVVDSVFAVGLLYADRRSRFIKEGGCSYFGNRVIFLEMLIPPVFALVYGTLFSNDVIMASGVAGLFITIVPFVALVPLRRHTDHSLLPGILHGFLYALILVVLL